MTGGQDELRLKSAHVSNVSPLARAGNSAAMYVDKSKDAEADGSVISRARATCIE